ncbi:hypothetical protein, partial [Sphingomonas sp. 10B4]|uniref:hypothetical protein n=1 Tax=Sphingomonas sp. 10B4 TaxID=3048575 RepID=UPI002B2220C4
PSAQQLNGSSQATMEKTLEGVCIPSHRVAPSSLTGQKRLSQKPDGRFLHLKHRIPRHSRMPQPRHSRMLLTGTQCRFQR